MAMQYSITLPTEYPVEKLRARVAERAPHFINVPGLIHKSFLLDAAARRYAPFYIWESHGAMRDFCFSDLFGGVIAVFGRPRIRHWSILSFDRGDRTITPRFACYEIDRVPQDAPLADLRVCEMEAHRLALHSPGLYARVVGLDSDRWEVVHYSLWADEKTKPKSNTDCMVGFEVMSIVEPNR